MGNHRAIDILKARRRERARASQRSSSSLWRGGGAATACGVLARLSQREVMARAYTFDTAASVGLVVSEFTLRKTASLDDRGEAIRTRLELKRRFAMVLHSTPRALTWNRYEMYWRSRCGAFRRVRSSDARNCVTK